MLQNFKSNFPGCLLTIQHSSSTKEYNHHNVALSIPKVKVKACKTIKVKVILRLTNAWIVIFPD